MWKIHATSFSFITEWWVFCHEPLFAYFYRSIESNTCFFSIFIIYDYGMDLTGFTVVLQQLVLRWSDHRGDMTREATEAATRTTTDLFGPSNPVTTAKSCKGHGKVLHFNGKILD